MVKAEIKMEPIEDDQKTEHGGYDPALAVVEMPMAGPAKKVKAVVAKADCFCKNFGKAPCKQSKCRSS